MADDSMQEKTEEATSRKLEKAREEGQIGKSIEIPSVFVLLAAAVALNASKKFIYAKINSIFYFTLNFNQRLTEDFTLNFCINTLYKLSGYFLLTLLPLFTAIFFMAILTTASQVGFVISWKAITPRFSKIDPIKGLGQKLSIRSVIELIKSILKIAIIGFIVYLSIASEIDHLKILYEQSVQKIFIYILDISYKIFIRTLLIMIFLAILDFAFQKWKFAKEQMMTKQEIKEEMKQAEGDPMVKSRIRQIQRETARKRMMGEVPNADVVITNPTHIAIAIKYDSLSFSAPILVAKGAGAIAERIKEIAEENNIPIVENKPIARSLYKLVDIGEEIPVDFYQAIAEILAHIYNMKK